MTLEIANTVSIFVSNQFPEFYKTEGPEFIAFMKAYYEWMESAGNPINKARHLAEYRSVDDTLDEFLSHFQNKYLFGIPKNILGDKRLLIKYALNIYRAKGSVEGYKLLFRLLYNQDIEVYFPAKNILKVSDGIWSQPKYLEISENQYAASLVGKKIAGFASGAEAVAEGYLKYPINGKVVGVLFISNITGTFVPNEIVYEHIYDANDDQVLNGPRILGSVTDMAIYQGGQNFSVGDVLKSFNSSGSDLEFRVSNTAAGIGTLSFTIVDGGTYYSTDATEIITRIPVNGVASGRAAGFNIGAISNKTPITYNTDMLFTYKDVTLNAADYGMQPMVLVTNVNSILRDALSYTTKFFGTIAALTNVSPGNNYTVSPTVKVRDLLESPIVTNNIFYSNTSNLVTGTNTNFYTYFSVSNSVSNVGATWSAVNNATSLTMNVVKSSVTGNITVGSLVLGNNLPTHPKYAFVSNVVNNSSSSNTVVTISFPSQNVVAGSSNTVNFYNSAETYIKLISNHPTETMIDYRIVKGVVNTTMLVLDDYPRYSGNGNILSIYIANTGSGYSNVDSVTITANASDTLVAGANVRIRTTQTGSIFGVVIADGGQGYYNIPTISITSPGGGIGANLVVSAISTPKFRAAYPLLSTALGTTGVSNGIYVNITRPSDGSIGGENSIILSDAAVGNGIISQVQIINSGLGFDDNTLISFGKHGIITQPIIISGGTGYNNTDLLTFAGGGAISPARGEIVTNSNGTITSVNMLYYGSGYQVNPNIRIRSITGSGANLYSEIGGLDTTYSITGNPIKSGVGIERGRWMNTQGFLNSDKKIQDSYYYQNYSYEIRAGVSLDRYVNIAKSFFHLSGTELFGRAMSSEYINSNSSIVAESVTST
jgi:hypothetical protein